MVTQQSFTYQGLPISYAEAGQGTPVILLHGFAETGNIWQEQVSFLQDYCRVLVPEIPGADWQESIEKTDLQEISNPLYTLPVAFTSFTSENSFTTARQIASSVDAMANALASFIKTVTTEPAILLGHSMGGYVTLAVAEKYPSLLKGYGLIHSTAFADTEEKKETRRKGISFIRNNGPEAFFKTSASGLFSEHSKERMPERLQQNIDMAVEYHPEILIANYEAMIARPDRTNVLAGNELPVLFVIGLEDKAAPAADVLKQVHLPQVSYFHLMDNVAHMGMWEATDEVNRLILKFIQDCD